MTTHIEPALDRHRRYHYVDLLRGAAALVVMISHYMGFFHGGEWMHVGMAQPPGYRWLWPIYANGTLAVYFFWALSGFVFAIAYGQYGRGLSLRDFVVHRFARLYPLHFVTLLIVAALQTIGMAINGVWQIIPNNDLPHFLLHLALASNWFTQDGSFNAPIWSVSVEIVIYLAFLAFMKIVGLRLLPALAVFVAFFVLERLTGNLIALCGAMFFIGMMLGIAIPWLQQRCGERRRGRVLLLVLGLTVLAAAMAGLWGMKLAGLEDLFAQYIWYVLIPAVLFAFALFDGNLPPLTPRLRWIGAITYAVYLIHLPLIIAARTFAPETFTDFELLRQWPMFLSYLAIVILLALPVHYWFELPAQRYFRRLGSRPSAR